MTKHVDHEKTAHIGATTPEHQNAFKAPAKLPALAPEAVRDALASVDHADLLKALCLAHGGEPVLAAVEAMKDDPNYGATARDWLAKP